MKDSTDSYLISKLRGREHLNHIWERPHTRANRDHKRNLTCQCIGGVLVREHHGASPKMPKLPVWSWSIFWGCPMILLNLVFGDDSGMTTNKYMHFCIYVTIWWLNMKRDMRQRRLWKLQLWKVFRLEKCHFQWKQTNHGDQLKVLYLFPLVPGHNAQKQIFGSFGQDTSSHRGTVVSCDLEWLDWENGWNHMESAMTIGERDIPDGLVFLLFLILNIIQTWMLLYNRALVCPLQWAWGAKANDATCWDSFLHGSRDDQCGYLWPESRCLDGRVQSEIESDQKFRTIIDTIRPSCIIFQPPVVLLESL